MNSKHVPRFQNYICAGIWSVHSCANLDRISATQYLLTILDVITGKIGIVKQRTTIESARHSHQLRHGHTPRKRVRPGMKYFSVHVNLGSIRFVASKDTNCVEGLEMDLIISSQCIRDVEVDRFSPKIGRHEPNNHTAIS